MTITWTPDMLATLRSMRAARHSLRVCAERIGVTEKCCHRKAVALGLNSRLSRGRRSGPAVLTQPPFNKRTYNRERAARLYVPRS